MAVDHPLDDLPAYALGCLEEPALEAVLQHLVICESCRAEVAALQEASAQIAVNIRMVKPPARLKSAILRQVEPQSQSGSKTGFLDWLRSLRPAWGAVSLAVIGLLVVSNLVLWGQMRSLQKPPQDPGFQVVSMLGTNPEDHSRGVMIVTESGRFGTLVVDGLTELNADQQYQLWLILDGVRTSGGVFSVDRWGYGALVIHAPQPLNAYSEFGVTIEPAGGSPQPSGDRVLGGSF